MADKDTKVPQIKRFREAARELGTDESEEAFDRALRKVASAPPAPMPKKRAAGKGRARVGRSKM